MKVRNKKIIVTGGGNGVGRALVMNLLTKGAKVIAVDINEAGLKETIKLSGENNNLITKVLDITNKEAVFNFAEDLIKEEGYVDGIINNAGIIQPFIEMKDLSFDQIDKVMNVNFYGTLYLTKAFLNHLLTRPEGHIVNIASMGGFFPVPGQSAYGASKAAVKLMTEGLYSELMDTNVRVSVVFPGAIATDIKRNSNLTNVSITEEQKNSKMMLSPVQAAEKIINGMEKDKYKFCIGKDSFAMDILYRFNSGFATKLIKKVMGSKKH